MVGWCVRWMVTIDILNGTGGWLNKENRKWKA
jgi:hypothetical protein